MKFLFIRTENVNITCVHEYLPQRHQEQTIYFNIMPTNSLTNQKKTSRERVKKNAGGGVGWWDPSIFCPKAGKP